MTLTLTNFEKKWGLLYLFLQLLFVPFGAAVVCAALGVVSAAAVNLASFFANAALAVVFFRELLRKSLENFRTGSILKVTAAGFCLYWVLNTLVSVLILTIDPDFSNINDSGINLMIDEFPVLMPLAIVFAVPLAEECLFRGWLFTGLMERSPALAYGVVTLGFAAVHMISYIGTCDALALALCTVQYLVPSAVLCWVCHRSDSLCAPLLLHMMINVLACLFLE